MKKLTLLTKVYHPNQLKYVGKILEEPLQGLNIEVKVTCVAANRWPIVTLLGEDETVATNLLARDFGFCPESLENLTVGNTVKGYMLTLNKSDETLQADVGVFQPEIAFASVSLSQLKTSLGSRRDFPMKKLVESSGLIENLPITIKIVDVDHDESRVTAELAESQIERLKFWRDSLLDRLMIVGASEFQVKLAVAQAGLNRDVITVEALGMFEHSLLCKLGTDATGLIPRLGRRLPNAAFTAYNPKKLLCS